jgi:hypothetical protein
MTDSILINDVQHWQNLKPPLAPNEAEIEIYREYIGDSKPVCLLGMTKELVPLCDFAVDLNPLNIGKPTIKSDWNDLEETSEVIIGDGILNFTGFQFVEKALSISKKLICRIFMAKQLGMKYATYFPKQPEFPGTYKLTHTQENIVIVMWSL